MIDVLEFKKSLNNSISPYFRLSFYAIRLSFLVFTQKFGIFNIYYFIKSMSSYPIVSMPYLIDPMYMYYHQYMVLNQLAWQNEEF